MGDFYVKMALLDWFCGNDIPICLNSENKDNVHILYRKIPWSCNL